MRIETKTETIVKEINTYIADDGKVFDTREECEKYEESYAEANALDELNDLTIETLKGVFPLHSSPDEFSDYASFQWFKVNNMDDIRHIESLLEKANYKLGYYTRNDSDISFPTYYGIEIYAEEDVSGPYTLEDLERLVTRYFKDNFKVEVEFKKGE